MPSKKQRRRQQKLRRHEYEDVWVDAEGNVIPDDAVDDVAPHAASNGAAKPRTGGGKRDAVRTSAGKIVPPASWSRVLKRGLIFAPLMFFLITLLPGGDRYSVAQRVFLTLQYVLMLVVFMYLTERLMYRVWQRRQSR